MQTNFSPERLADPKLASLEKVLRSCVHCGFCTATCPTYVVHRDERNSPRGRIYLIKDLLETGRAPGAEDVAQIDPCLSCYSCMTTCPSGVDYRRLIDHAHELVETVYRRGLADRGMRRLLGFVLPSPLRFRFAIFLAGLGRPFGPLIAKLPGIGEPVAAMLALAPRRLKARVAHPYETPAPGPTTAGRRVALLTGCAQEVLAPETNEAMTRILNRLGFDVVRPKGEGCCGSLSHHMGFGKEGRASMRANIDAWTREIEGKGLEAIVATASGCGSTIKDYGHLLADDPAYAAKAARVSALAKDPTEFLLGLDPEFPSRRKLVVAYHAACSLQHGQKITEAPKQLLKRAGFDVRSPAESHLCCGSAGVYNILQPETANALKARKVANLQRLKPDLIAAGNIGCLTQIGAGANVPVVHTVELLDWAMGGPEPAALRERAALM